MVNEVVRQIIRRRFDEPKLEIGSTISLKHGATGVVVARFTRPGRQNEVCYLVECKPPEANKEGAGQKRSAPA